MADSDVQLKLTGRATSTRLPALLTTAARSVGHPEDEFLPPGYLQATRTIDVSASARSAPDGVTQQQHTLAAGEVIVLELTDGSILITSAERLRATLDLTHPELLGPDGEVLLERLRAKGAAPGRGLAEAAGGLVSKVYTLVTSGAPNPIIDAALDQLKKWGGHAGELGVSWLGTKALMWAIERRLPIGPGLYHWGGAGAAAAELEPAQLDEASVDDAQQTRPMLVFVHGTASSTVGSFGDLRAGDRDLWVALERHYSAGIYAFEHATLSLSPIENAIALVQALPRGAHVSLVSHSRGGLVADLLCLGDFDALIDGYAYAFEGTGDADADEAGRVIGELKSAHAVQREQLRTLAGALRDRKIVVQRYVRAASPANGTKLASGNFDVFLSGMLTLIGQVPFFFGSPLYSAFKRVVLEIARNRTNPHLVPGIEAMLPDSPMARLLRDAPVRSGISMSVIAGDIEGGNLLKRLGVLLTDFLLFDNDDNDLVVNTTAMLAGVAPKADARVLFDRGADVSHFRYFTNIDTRAALRDWLTVADPLRLEAFRALPSPGDYVAALAAAASRDASSADRPVVVVLPGVMGSHLQVGVKDRVWFDPLDIATGGLEKIQWGRPGVEADDLFAKFYGKLCEHLAGSHRVERFPYDWRQPLDVLAERFGEFLDRLMKETQQPIRLLAHSMGGLVVRATIHKRRPVMDALMRRDGARLLMLGTPHQGAHSMVENLLGKGDTLRTLVRLDLHHDMQQVLDIVAGFRGALNLLPKPGFKDIFQGQADGGGLYDYQQAATWQEFQTKTRDLWFGNGKVGQPAQDALDSAAWLWAADGPDKPSLPLDYEPKSAYVFGVAPNTPCGVREVDGRLKMVGTTRGDGTVTWESGRIGGIGSFFYMPAAHGDLTATAEYFPALTEWLASGATARMPAQPPASRAIEQPTPVSYDAGPPTADDPDALERSLLGGSLRNRVPPRPKRRMEVTVKAMDLRFLSQPIMVGHYEQDPIAGPQALIDRELLAGDLSERHSLGLYAGPRGTAAVVLRAPNAMERQRGSLSGAIVTGLGPYDGALSMSDLTESVRTGALRYLLQVVDVLGKQDREVPLATLLLGYNSSANLTVPASVEALVHGVMEANARFFETTRLNIRIARLDIVEIYLDTAITAVYALRYLAPRLSAKAELQGTTLVCRSELEQGEGVRQRLFDSHGSSYWPRLMVTDADRGEGQCPPGCYEPVRGGRGNLGNQAPEPATTTPVADRLRFLYVGQRARAESVVQQRQPGLIEKLVRQQIHVKLWQPDFGRMLFQLMVPHDFKDAARQLDRVVLVVDSTTANLPWELMLADDPTRRDDDKRPLALRTAVVRQLSSTAFRRSVRQAIARTALVVGNPSVEGFATAFPSTGPRPTEDPPALAGAQLEAEAVVTLLGGMGYRVEQVIGDDQPASNVLAALYRQPWRILHISAHGIYDLLHADGRRRSGVVLSDGLLVTAAEIGAMEVVPEFVFLNCCHLGQVDFGREGNKLAASVARELIDIGVRCVVVAGWAVNDEYARLFGQTLYQQLLQRRLNFGDAMFQARLAVWEANRDDITWGAFQAYGDPGWLAEPRADDNGGAGDGGMYVSPNELLDDLARTRAELSRRRDPMNAREIDASARDIDERLRKRCPPGWLGLAQLQSALGATWRDLGRLERARECYIAAIQAEDKLGQVPIRDIEQLAHIEARLGEKLGEAELSGPTASTDAAAETASAAPGTAAATPRAPHSPSAAGLIELALQRLDGLDRLVSAQPDATGPTATVQNSDRSALRGDAWKRMASLHARRLLRGGLGVAAQASVRQAMHDALSQSIEAYRSAEGSPASGRFVPHLAASRLALDALTPWDSPQRRDEAIALAQQCRQTAAQRFARSAGLWDAVMQADALMVEMLIDGSLGDAGDAGRQRFDELVVGYAQAMDSLCVKPTQIDVLLGQIELLALFCQALGLESLSDRAWPRIAARLLELVQHIQPGRSEPGGYANRPPRARVKATATASPAARTPPPPAAPPPPASKTKPKAAATARRPAAKKGSKRPRP